MDQMKSTQEDWVTRLHQHLSSQPGGLDLAVDVLASKIGYSNSGIRLWLSRNRSPRRIETLIDVAVACDLPPAWLIFGGDLDATGCLSTDLERRLLTTFRSLPEALQQALITVGEDLKATAE